MEEKHEEQLSKQTELQERQQLRQQNHKQKQELKQQHLQHDKQQTSQHKGQHQQAFQQDHNQKQHESDRQQQIEYDKQQQHSPHRVQLENQKHIKNPQQKHPQKQHSFAIRDILNRPCIEKKVSKAYSINLASFEEQNKHVAFSSNNYHTQHERDCSKPVRDNESNIDEFNDSNEPLQNYQHSLRYRNFDSITSTNDNNKHVEIMKNDELSDNSDNSSLDARLVIDTHQIDLEEKYETANVTIIKNRKRPSKRNVEMALDERRKKPRTVFTRKQINRMESTFQKKRYLPTSERIQLAESLRLSETQVKIWFQNRRNKWKRKLLADIEFHNLSVTRYHHFRTNFIELSAKNFPHVPPTLSSRTPSLMAELPLLSQISPVGKTTYRDDMLQRSIFPFPPPTPPHCSPYPLHPSQSNSVFNFSRLPTSLLTDDYSQVPFSSSLQKPSTFNGKSYTSD